MKNPFKLKVDIRRIASAKKLSAPIVLQNYMLERFAERVSISEYRNVFVVKGGFLIAAMVGLGARTTMDIDVNIRKYPLNEDSIRSLILSIAAVEVDDGVSFSLVGIREIREDDEYGGYRVSLKAVLPPMSVPVKLDISTGDVITPDAIEYNYKLMFEERTIPLRAYNLETILAEKLETILKRKTENTRMRDFYDIFILRKLYSESLDLNRLATAARQTFQKRESLPNLKDYKQIMKEISESDAMMERWRLHCDKAEYLGEIDFSDTCKVVLELLDDLSSVTSGSK